MTVPCSKKAMICFNILQTVHFSYVVDVKQIHLRWPFIIWQVLVGWNYVDTSLLPLNVVGVESYYGQIECMELGMWNICREVLFLCLFFQGYTR